MLADNRLPISDLNAWCFIGGVKKNNESFEETICREIEKETSLKFIAVKFLGILHYNDGEKYVYHAILTADNLNHIKRGEGQNLDFFKLQEVEKLHLESVAQMFLLKNKDVVEKILHN